MIFKETISHTYSVDIDIELVASNVASRLLNEAADLLEVDGVDVFAPYMTWDNGMKYYLNDMISEAMGDYLFDTDQDCGEMYLDEPCEMIINEALHQLKKAKKSK